MQHVHCFTLNYNKHPFSLSDWTRGVKYSSDVQFFYQVQECHFQMKEAARLKIFFSYIKLLTLQHTCTQLNTVLNKLYCAPYCSISLYWIINILHSVCMWESDPENTSNCTFYVESAFNDNHCNILKHTSTAQDYCYSSALFQLLEHHL